MSTGWRRCRGSTPVTMTGYIAAMENRRQYFKDNGAVSSDHSHLDARTDTLEIAEAERIYALPGRVKSPKWRLPRCVAI